MHIDAHGPEMHSGNAGAMGRCLWSAPSPRRRKIEIIMGKVGFTRINRIVNFANGSLCAAFCDASDEFLFAFEIYMDCFFSRFDSVHWCARLRSLPTELRFSSFHEATAFGRSAGACWCLASLYFLANYIIHRSNSKQIRSFSAVFRKSGERFEAIDRELVAFRCFCSARITFSASVFPHRGRKGCAGSRVSLCAASRLASHCEERDLHVRSRSRGTEGGRLASHIRR